MLFNSFNFWLVFPLLFILYWLIPSRCASYKKWYLIIVSYLLYMNWKPAFAVVLLFVTGITFYGAKTLSVEDKQKRYGMIWIFALLSLLPLLLWGMFLKTVIADRMGMYVDSIYPNYIHYSGKICLLGSSFYTMQIYADFAEYSFFGDGHSKDIRLNGDRTVPCHLRDDIACLNE